MTVLYLNTDDFMVIADNGRVLGLGFIRAHLERRGKTVRWLWRAFIFSLQLRSSNLSGFSVETSNNYPPYTLKHTHMWVCFRSGWCHVSAVEWSSEGCMFPFSAFWLLHMQNSPWKEARSKVLKSFIRGVISNQQAPNFNRTTAARRELTSMRKVGRYSHTIGSLQNEPWFSTTVIIF